MLTDLPKKTIHWIGLQQFPTSPFPPSLVVSLGLHLAPAQRLHCPPVRRSRRGGATRRDAGTLARAVRAPRAEVQQSCESAFCRLCFEWCYCNRCLLCAIVPVCALSFLFVIIFFSSSHFNGCVTKRPRRCRLPIRQRSFKVTILQTCSLLKKTCLSLAYGVQSV